MAARPEVASASTQDGGEGRKFRHRHTKDGGRVRCFLTFSIWRQGRPPQGASIRLPERNADADASPALARRFLRRFPLCGHRLWGQRRLGQAGAFRQSNRRSGVLPAAILRRSNSHIGAVPVTSALLRQERQWRGARGAARPGRGHRAGAPGSEQRTSRTATSPSRTAGMSSIALVSEWEWLLGALAGPAPKRNRGNPGGGGKRCRSVGGIPGKWKAAEAARTELEAGSSQERYKKCPKEQESNGILRIPRRPQSSGKAERRKQSLKRQMSQILPKASNGHIPWHC
ncbi:uncharacterized protein LOC120410944 isoform X2 [Corvus cornix cornix]|uniref:uncharacterized protein LOC120410944 isoform X2 n=1 Tax=Corvus cornix cornix TaxID=932674 RepID=UPI0019513CE9|nr:uncharacterized protein LOC120410944 isoform X2 [Corvus cornix cornix]